MDEVAFTRQDPSYWDQPRLQMRAARRTTNRVIWGVDPTHELKSIRTARRVAGRNG